MPGAGYEVSWAGGLPVVVTPEEIDAGNAADLRRSLLSCANGSHPTLVVDMSGTAFCDSTGVHQLVRARARAIAAGGEVRLVIRTAPVLRLFAIMGIDRLFPVFATLTEAVAGGEAASPPARAPGPLAAQHTEARPATG
jgi:anti-sigma B factor antagonist